VRVLITVPCLELSGGVANYYRALRVHLDEDKVYFEVGRRPGEAGPVAAIFRLIADFWRFHRKLGQKSWDLVHINPSMVRSAVIRDGLLLLIARAHGIRVLVFFRGWDPEFALQIRTRYIRMFKAVFGWAAGFIVLAVEFRDILADMALTGPVFIGTTVVDDSLMEPVLPEAGRSNAEARVCNILYLSRLDSGKGLPEAIDAFARTSAMWPGVTLTVAGDGPERSKAEAGVSARGLTGVRFVGHVDGPDKASLFRDADIFLFPTAYAEGMPNAVLEAMASGLPVVTRTVGGIRDFFENGRMGFVTGSRDPSVLAGFLSRLVGDPALRASIGSYNRDYARRRFAASVVAARLLEIYARVGRQANAY